MNKYKEQSALEIAQLINGVFMNPWDYGLDKGEIDKLTAKVIAEKGLNGFLEMESENLDIALIHSKKSAKDFANALKIAVDNDLI